MDLWILVQISMPLRIETTLNCVHKKDKEILKVALHKYAKNKIISKLKIIKQLSKSGENFFDCRATVGSKM